MLSIKDLDFHFGGRTLYSEASLHIKPKDRIGLIGLNGTGKSTLLRIISGEYTPDGGEISRSGDCTIGFLNQDLLSYQIEDSILSIAMQAFEEANQLQAQIDKILHELETNPTDALINRLSNLQERFASIDGYTIQSKTEEILEGLGFQTHQLHQPISSFSGGWRMRVMLARLLLQKPSLLMLDEPTNHLDLPSIQWLENYLQAYEGAIIVVSHDKYFLDKVVNIIVEVSFQKLNIFSGNYSFYEREKALRQEIQKGAFENQQAMIRQTERFIERFKAKASKARQVQSRVKALEKMDLVEGVVEDLAKVNFKFNFNTQPGRHVMQLENFSKSYGALVIFDKAEARIERGDKIALIGANGKGKSTLLRIVGGTEKFEGKRMPGHNVIQTFYAQHQLESLNLKANLIEELKNFAPEKSEAELRNILGCFLFSDDDVFKKIKVLSGGEKSRVALAKTLLSRANFLLLDEPTNHLDYLSVGILIRALQQYKGTFILVSHDRHFVTEVANKIWWIEGNKLKEYPGTYREYLTWVEEKKSGVMPPAPQLPKKDAPVAKPEPPKKENNNGRKYEINLQLQELEEKIGQLESKKKEIEKQLESARADEIIELSKGYKSCHEELARVQYDWDRLVDTISH